LSAVSVSEEAAVTGVNVLRPFHGLRSSSIPRDVSRSAALTRWPARSLSRHKLTTASQCVRSCSGAPTLTFASCWVFCSPLAYDSSRRASAPSGALQLFLAAYPWPRLCAESARSGPGSSQDPTARSRLSAPSAANGTLSKRRAGSPPTMPPIPAWVLSSEASPDPRAATGSRSSRPGRRRSRSFGGMPFERNRASHCNPM